MTILDIVREVAPDLERVSDKQLYNSLVMWMFRGLSYVGLNARLKKLAGCKIPTNDIVERLNESGDIMKSYKLWMFYVVHFKCDERKAAALAKRWNVQDGNMNLFRMVQRPTMVYLKRLATQYPALSVEKLNEYEDEIVRKVRSTARKFVWVKMRFIADHQRTGDELPDFEQATIEKGLQGLRLQYPIVQSKLHAINIVKHIVRNTGLNMIQKFTRLKNNALIPAEGTQSRILDVNNLPADMVPEAPQVRETTDLYMDFKKVMHKWTDKRRTLLGLLAGLHSVKFSNWLRDVKGIATPNDELIDRVNPSRYMTLCREYIDVAGDLVDRFLTTVRSMLQPYQVRTA